MDPTSEPSGFFISPSFVFFDRHTSYTSTALSHYSKRSRIPRSLLQILIRNTPSQTVGKVGSVHREGMYDRHSGMDELQSGNRDIKARGIVREK